MMTKVACFSVACVDYYPQHDQCFPGGNALNQSVRFRELGWDTLFAGAVGDDAAGLRIRGLLARHGVDLKAFHVLEGEITASNRILVDGEGERFSEAGAWSNGAYGSFRMCDQDWGYVQTCPLWSTHFNAPDFSEALSRKPSETLLFVDFLHLPDWEILEQSIARIDIAYIGGIRSQADRLQALSARNPDSLIVLTLGKGGSLAMRAGRRWVKPALATDPVVDTTGCGDAFQSSFSVEWLRSGSVEAALRAGAESGRQCAGRLGGQVW